MRCTGWPWHNRLFDNILFTTHNNQQRVSVFLLKVPCFFSIKQTFTWLTCRCLSSTPLSYTVIPPFDWADIAALCSPSSLVWKTRRDGMTDRLLTFNDWTSAPKQPQNNQFISKRAAIKKHDARWPDSSDKSLVIVPSLNTSSLA